MAPCVDCFTAIMTLALLLPLLLSAVALPTESLAVTDVAAVAALKVACTVQVWLAPAASVPMFHTSGLAGVPLAHDALFNRSGNGKLPVSWAEAALAGPRLDAFSVNVTFCPGMSEPALALIAAARSACGGCEIATDLLAELLDLLGSAVLAEIFAVTVAFEPAPDWAVAVSTQVAVVA